MTRLRGAAVLVAAALLLSALAPLPFAAVGTAGAVPDARVAVTDATVSPATPTAGAPVTVSATVRLSAGSASAADLTRVELRDGDDAVGVARDLGSLSPGETLTVPVTATFDDPGERSLTVVARFEDADGDAATARRPLSLVVEPGAPQVEFDVDDPVAGAPAPLRVTVSNPTTVALRDVTVTATAPAEGPRTRRTVASLDAGEATTLNLSVTPAEAGDREFAFRVSYATAAGTRGETTFARTVAVDGLSADVGVRAAPVRESDSEPGGTDISSILGGGAAGALQPQTGSGGGDGGAGDAALVGVTVTNFGNAPVDDVVVVPRTANGSRLPGVGRYAVADTLAPGESTTAEVDLSATDAAGPVTFVAAYDLAGSARENRTVYEFRPARGAVELTDLNVSVADGRATLRGNLGNVGGGEVTGAVVSVVESEGVDPAYPQRSYFVGSVAGSEFAPFRLAAGVDSEGADAVTVEVRYTAGNDRVTRRVDVPLPDEGTGASPALGERLVPVGAVVLLGVSLPVAAVLVRRYRR
ncbi:hypothetical protein [Candidatus Halobonum tyrrellensis]|uniref:CARDB domain-containing protein n=1 Tax=Candidatus Halobonum tyrrellensis G22 TaxID=1324957 RepID=V4GPF8_9EURY|nr:hypothetical protein [Candidatus Halobonum tyrrellensis]ESP87266.1 hypothetical protein K933_14308 [Candidatus Halobonum tyrrellensis G22]